MGCWQDVIDENETTAQGENFNLRQGKQTARKKHQDKKRETANGHQVKNST